MTTVGEELAGLEVFSGTLLGPTDDGYEEARRVHNAMIDRRPALIAKCRGTADVAAAVIAARENDLEISIRGGGHNVAGRAVTDGGLMIDLSPMRGIHVDPATRTGRAQGGVTWAELNRETQLHGLAVTGGAISTTGIAGLTLGGGFGFLMGKHGLTVDNLLSVELVTSGGTVLTASEDEHPDLFWALRGGGGNFGVVTSFEYRLHPIGPTVVGGAIVHPIEAAGDLFRFYRDVCAAFPDDVVGYPALVHAPDGSRTKLAGVMVGHVGEHEQARKDLAELVRFGTPLDVAVGPIAYTTLNTLIDDACPRGALYYWKSSFLSELSDDAIDTLVERFAICPPPMSLIVLEDVHGEATRVAVDATAVPHRQRGFNLGIYGTWRDPKDTDELVAWTRETYEAMEPFLSGLRYVNYLGDDETGDEPIRAAFGPNYERLVDVKTAYDPDNVFHLNQNIRPRP
jgi:FAD/FMN-containing dehydrogenase